MRLFAVSSTTGSGETKAQHTTEAPPGRLRLMIVGRQAELASAAFRGYLVSSLSDGGGQPLQTEAAPRWRAAPV